MRSKKNIVPIVTMSEVHDFKKVIPKLRHSREGGKPT
jgi:hypothetical protein